jgi:signal transduction histidine kinase/ActR/RegA family two-component response regulator
MPTSVANQLIGGSTSAVPPRAVNSSGLGLHLSYVPVLMPPVSPQPQSSAPASPDPPPWFLQGGGISGATARAVRWEETPLGGPDGWPATLKTTLATMFRARQPMFLWWGQDLIQFYNDAYLPSFGNGKHPRAMGQAGRECWQEIWPIIGPQIDDAMERGIASWNEDSLVPILRNGRNEEVYWTYTYSPAFGETGAVEGTLVICTETTNRVLGERRAHMLHALVGETSVASDRTSLIARALETIGRATADIPFAGIYERHPATAVLAPVATVGIDAPSARAVGERVRVELARRSDAGPLLVSSGEEPARAPDIYVAPLPARAAERSSLLVMGLSARLSIDEPYRRFLEQVSGHLQLAKTRVDQTADRSAIDLERRSLVEQTDTEREQLLGELQSASRAKDEFLAMLGHELRNPLSPIITALRLMRQKNPGVLTREQQVIERQVNHLIRLVDDLLDVSKIARGKVELRREIVDLADVAAKAVEMASDLLEQRHHRLSIHCEKGRFLCHADPIRLAQVIANLLTNAARYTDPGGDIALSVTAHDGQLILTVEDNGIGISPEMLTRVFNLFEQAARSADRAQGGLGLGLSLVKNLVALHGGTVSAHSDGPGRGSTFTVCLPVALDQISQDAAVRHRASPTPASSGRVLIVDDNIDAAELLQHALEATGYAVEMATDPITALDVAVRFAPEVAILDIGLPVIDGYELATRLLALPEVANCRLIALTGYGQEHDRRRSLDAGFHEHLVKPVDVDRLIRLVEAVRAAPPSLLPSSSA